MENQEHVSLLVCNSNMFVPYTLTEILSNPEKKYLVISDIESIKKFFDLIELPNADFYMYGYNPRIDGYFGFIKAKRKLFNHVSQYSLDRVIFFHAEYGQMANWLIEKLSKNASIEYCKVYDSMPLPKAPLTKRRVIIDLQQRIWWGQKMDIIVSSRPFPSLPKSFFQKVKARQITMPVDAELNSNYVKKKLAEFDIKGSTVLLTGTTVCVGMFTEETYVPFVNSLIEAIGEDNVCSKCHPRFNKLYGKENELRQVPSFIPGNVLLDSFDCYIGFESTLLVEAAHAGKTTISLIDCLRPAEEVRLRYHDFLENRLRGKGIIHFPQSIEEVKSIVTQREI